MDKREAISALWGVKSASARGALRFALSERDPTLQLNAAAALLAANDVSALPMATDALLQTRQSLPPDVLLNLRGAISRGVTSETAIPALARLLRATDPGTRRAAALALGRTSSEAALPTSAKPSRILTSRCVGCRERPRGGHGTAGADTE